MSLTTTSNDAVVERLPSDTVMLIVAVPLRSAAGVTVTVRSAPLPARTMLPFGIRLVLLELAPMISPSSAVASSPTLNVNAPVLPSSSINWSPIPVTVGAFGVVVTVALAETLDSPPEPSAASFATLTEITPEPAGVTARV